MRVLFSLALLCTTACAYPQHKAERTVEFTVPAEGMTGLLCESHNGAIRVTGDSKLDRVEVRVDISIRGHTQEEADANLQLLDVARETKDGVLQLHGKTPKDLPDGASPGFAFTVRLPERCQLTLSSHNGAIEAQGTKGDVQLATHNGHVRADVTSARLQVATHNGGVEFTARGSEPVSGSIETHNGSVTLALPDGAGAKVKASTHNGGIAVDGAARTMSRSNRSVEASYGDGQGSLTVVTHNGGVRLQ